MPRGTPSWASNLDRFLIDLGCQLRPPEPPKSLKFRWFYSILAFFTHFKIRSIFDPILAPTLLHSPSSEFPLSNITQYTLLHLGNSVCVYTERGGKIPGDLVITSNKLDADKTVRKSRCTLIMMKRVGHWLVCVCTCAGVCQCSRCALA